MHRHLRRGAINKEQYLQGTEDFDCPLHYKTLFKEKGLSGEQGIKLRTVNNLEDPEVRISSSVSWAISQAPRLSGLFLQDVPPEHTDAFALSGCHGSVPSFSSQHVEICSFSWW